MGDSKKRSSRRNTPRKNRRRNKAHLDALIAEAIVDAYNESEQTVGFHTMMETRFHAGSLRVLRPGRFPLLWH